MAVLDGEVRTLTKRLIETVTGFTPDEENYDTCYQFCMSNLKYHRFLDINSSNVTRSIKSVVTKFQIHSLPERAHQLSISTDQLLSLGFCPKSDLHYKVLHFLLETSASPTNAPYELPVYKEPLVVKKQRDTFDWEAYLMEGIEIPSFSDTTSEEMYDLSDADTSSSEDEKKDSDYVEDSFEDLRPEENKDLYSLAVSQLTNQVTPVYWEPYSVHNTVGSRGTLANASTGHPSCNFLYDCGCSRVPNLTIVTEVQAVRETLWMLMGKVGGCVYHKESLQVNTAVAMNHTSLLSFQRLLEDFSELGIQLQAIRNRVEEAIDPSSNSTQVFQGSMNFVHKFIRNFNDSLMAIERQVSKNERFVSLIALKKELTFFRREIVCVYSVLEGYSTKQNYILDVLWEHLDFHDSMNDKKCVSVVIPWLLATLRPYMEILNKWLSEGELVDPRAEFFVKRNPSRGNSWREGFSLDKDYPVCFRPVVDKVFVAGKSWCYIESLSKKNLLPQMNVNRLSLFEEFIDRLSHTNSDNKSQRRSSLEEESPTSLAISSHGRGPVVKAGLVANSPLPPYLVMNGMDDVLCNFLKQASLSSTNNIDCAHLLASQCSQDNTTLVDACRSGHFSGPVTMAISECIQCCVESRYNEATTSLTNILKTQYKLLEHFNIVRRFFLMEAGDIMHTFSSLLFDKMMSGTVWLDTSFLNSILEESVQGHYSHVEDMLLIEVDSSVPAVVSLDSLAGFSLQYKISLIASIWQLTQLQRQ